MYRVGDVLAGRKLRILSTRVSTQISTLAENIKDTALARVVLQDQMWFTQFGTQMSGHLPSIETSGVKY